MIIAQDREGGQEGYVLGLRARGRGGDRMGRAGGEKDVLSELCRTVWNPLVVRLLSCFHATDCSTTAYLSFIISWSCLKFTSTGSVRLSNRLILCHPLLLLPSIFLSSSVFPHESALRIRWPK